jgi:hypothetical protein
MMTMTKTILSYRLDCARLLAESDSTTTRALTIARPPRNELFEQLRQLNTIVLGRPAGREEAIPSVEGRVPTGRNRVEALLLLVRQLAKTTLRIFRGLGACHARRILAASISKAGLQAWKTLHLHAFQAVL